MQVRKPIPDGICIDPALLSLAPLANRTISTVIMQTPTESTSSSSDALLALLIEGVRSTGEQTMYYNLHPLTQCVTYYQESTQSDYKDTDGDYTPGVRPSSHV